MKPGLQTMRMLWSLAAPKKEDLEIGYSYFLFNLCKLHV